ncbi:MAG: hypothetical protein N3A54_00435 [Patescibacteria group bacterium]|nr:hypothetical protein [Patescibacteria group bacterium]
MKIKELFHKEKELFYIFLKKHILEIRILIQMLAIFYIMKAILTVLFIQNQT